MAQTNMTAVEWYAKEHHKLLIQLENKELSLGAYVVKHSDILKQSKQMEAEQNKVTEDTSDGFHTFKELYDFRMMYNAALFNEWALQKKYEVHKSWLHHDGELCLGGGWFIVVAILPTGQISNHYPSEQWDLFKIPETETALFPFDGHTSQDVLNRLKNL